MSNNNYSGKGEKILQTVQHEDIIWKHIFNLFKDEGLKFFGIDETITERVNTENIAVNVIKRIDDMIYNTTASYLLHFEFQSDKTAIVRFMLAIQ